MLHNQCPEDKEWSGLLVAKITKGGIDDIENLEIACEAVFLMDFGDATFTSFEGNAEDYLKFFDQYPQIDPVKKEKDSPWFIGKIHSHHSMKAYHSGVDTADLYENAPKLPFFLSLVVNYACNPFAEIAIAGTYKEAVITETKWSLSQWGRKHELVVPKETTEPMCFVIPTTVHYENQSIFIEQINAVRDREKTVTVYTRGGWQDKEKKDIKVESGSGTGKTITEKTDAEKGGIEYNQKIYNRMMPALGELLSLGLLFNVSPSDAISQIDKAIEVPMRNDYVKAVKWHFWHEWYDSTFYNMANCDEEEVLACFDKFISLHDNRWIYIVFKDISRGLKAELSLLRQIQGSTLV